MFERGKKDKDVLDNVNTESSGTPGDWKPASDTRAARPTGRSDVAVIGRSIQIDGDLRGEEDLRIEGDVTGTIQLRNNTLTIGSEGNIHATVYAKSVTVDGTMQGDIFGSEQVSIRKMANVNGNVTAPRVSLEDGAKFKGSIEMDPAAVEKALGSQSSASKSSNAVDAPANNSSRSKNELHLPKSEAASGKSSAKNSL